MASLITRSVPSFFVLLCVIDLNNDIYIYHNKHNHNNIHNHNKQGESLVHVTLDQVEKVACVVFCDLQLFTWEVLAYFWYPGRRGVEKEGWAEEGGVG